MGIHMVKMTLSDGFEETVIDVPMNDENHKKLVAAFEWGYSLSIVKAEEVQLPKKIRRKVRVISKEDYLANWPYGLIDLPCGKHARIILPSNNSATFDEIVVIDGEKWGLRAEQSIAIPVM